MKRKVGLLFTLIIVIVSSVTLGAIAASNLEQISAFLNKDLKINLKGKDFQAKDSDGKILQPITYNNSTYLPVRAIGEAFGVKVNYNDDSSTVLLGDNEMPAVKDPTIIDEWRTVVAPPAPELKQVKLDPKTTALLVLDIQKASCTQEVRPRCVASIQKVKDLLDLARKYGMTVVHSITSNATPEDIVPALTPQEGEMVVKSGVDKFYKTDLEKILHDKGVKTVVVVGTAAHGAVLHTVTGAALRNIPAIVPVDGMSSESAYAEQYTAWHMLNAPGTRNKVTLTKMSLISIDN
jgi:nicotinamidase-related amidase